MDVKETRVENLRRLIVEYGAGNQRKFSETYDLNKAHVSQMITRHRDIGDKVARKIEEKLNLERGYMDKSHDEHQAQLTPEELKLIDSFRLAPPAHRFVVLSYLAATPARRDLLTEDMMTTVFRNHVPDDRLGEEWASPEARK